MWGVQDIEEGKIRKVFSSQMSECHHQKGRITRLILEVSEIMNLFWWFIMAQWLTSQIDNENDKITFLWVHFWKQWMCSWPPTFCRHHNTIYKLDHSLQVCAIVSVNLKLLSNVKLCLKSKQDHRRWRYHRRLLEYQCPYFQLII